MRQPQTVLSASYSFLIQNEESETLFENVVAQVIDDILSSLGDNNKQAIYRHLKINYGINELPHPYGCGIL